MVKVIKPRTLGIITRTQPRPGGATLVVSVYGLFDATTAGIFLADQALWPTLLKEMPEGAIFDTGMLKPQGEVLVAGRATTPGGSPIRAMMIEVGVGPMAKRTAVFGERHWISTGAGFIFSEPVPFTQMLIDPKRMFGGAGHPVNTAGVGYQARRTFDASRPSFLPNFEDPGRLIRNIDDAPLPPGLGPIDPMSRERLKFAGTYDQLWQETLAPGLPIDADPRLFCAAPEDQRITGFFAGNEPLRVIGMTPDAAGYSGSLPGLCARSFAIRTSEPASLYELDMKLDTVLILGSLAKGVAVFRAALPVSDIDAKDVASIMIAYERMGDEPRPMEHYAEVYRLRSDKEQGHKYVFAEAQLTPELSDAEKLRRRKGREDHTRAFEERFAEGMHLVARRQFADAGLPESLVPAKPDPVPLPLLLPSPEDIETGDFDMAEMIDGIERESQKVRQQLTALQAAGEAARGTDGSFDVGRLLGDMEGMVGTDIAQIRQGMAAATAELPSLDALLAGLANAPQAEQGQFSNALSPANALVHGILAPPPPPSDDDALEEAKARFLVQPNAGVFGKMRNALEDAQKRLATQDMPAGDRAQEPSGALLGALDKAPASGPQNGTAEKLAAVDQQLRGIFPALAKSAAPAIETLLDELSAAMPASKSDALNPKLDDVREKIDDAETMMRDGMAQLRRLAVEATFPETPLAAGTALRFGMFVFESWRQGMDLRGRDLAGADLSGMNLSGADLTGAFLERANLSRTILTGALCEDAVFTGAVLNEAKFDDAILKGANFCRASARSTSFKRADLERIKAIEASFVEADFEAARFSETMMIKTDFTDARLSGVTARKLTLLQCPFDRVEAEKAVFERCQLIDLSAENLNLRGASLIRCQILKFRAPNADFSGAVLDHTGFASGAELPGGRFDGASMIGVTLQGADLTGGSFTRARLDGATLGEAKLSQTDFVCASMKRTQLGSVDLSQANLFAANLFEAQLRRANLTAAKLRSANLYSADLSDADLTGADLTAANGGKTRLSLETNHAA